MEALQFDPVKKELMFTKIPKPKLERPDDVIVEVAYAGLCGTDLHIIQGELDMIAKKPLTLGHEFSGVVREMGKEVFHVKPGDKVTIDPQTWCTTCRFCTTARYSHCYEGGWTRATGIMTDGGWSKFCKVRARQIYKIAPSMSLKQGALCEPMSCQVRAFDRCIRCTPIGETILITGAGIIGSMSSAILHHTGHRKVLISDPAEPRREINKRLETGFEVTCPEVLKEKIEKGYVADLAIECSGAAQAVTQCIDALNKNGRLCILGVVPPIHKIELSPYEIFHRELTIFGSFINCWGMPHAINLIDVMGTRYIDYERLGCKEFDLSQYKEAVELLGKFEISKVIFKLNPDLDC